MSGLILLKTRLAAVSGLQRCATLTNVYFFTNRQICGNNIRNHSTEVNEMIILRLLRKILYDKEV
jgi:hypothetical protein